MRHVWQPGAMVTGLLLLLTYFLIQSQNPALALRAHLLESLQAIHLHDTELAREVLLARAGLLPHYDTLPRTSQHLARALEAVRAESARVTGPVAREMRQYVEDLAAALHQKLTLVEYFTSDNAVLQNSVRYLTHIGQTLGTRLAVEHAVAADVAVLSHVMLRFLHTPDQGVGAEVEAALQRLSTVAASQRELQVLVAHGRLLREVLPQVDTLLRQILTAPTTARVDALQDAVLQYAHRVEARAQVFRVLLYLVAVILLGYLLYQYARLRAHARALRRANADVRASEERFRAITESANDAIISADRAGNIVSWNTRAETIFGYKAADILGTPLTRLIPARYQTAHRQRFAQWATTGAARLVGTPVEFAGVRQDGSEFPLELSLSTWATAHDHYVTGMVRDLTAQKQLQETTRQQELQLIQANKMTALGTLVSGVAHEINNPTQVVLMNTRVLAHAWDDAVDLLDAQAQDSGTWCLGGLPYAEMRDTIPVLVREVHDSARRIERIISDLKDFARPRARGAPTPVQVNDAVQHALRLLAHLIKQRTDHLHVDLASGLPSVWGDAQHVEQVVVNLVTNALEALPDRRCGVTVATAFEVAKHRVVLEVRDEGVGIAPEHLGRLCDPFFTTKQERGGTGLGLAITSSLVRLHGGRLTFASVLGKGTRALVTFPYGPEEGITPESSLM